jgi:hypothetical protein
MRRIVAIVGAATVAVAAWLAAAALAYAATPTPAGDAGDPRSAGQGPGLVGDPLFAVLAVVVIGLTAVLVTTAWIRLTARRGG